MLMTFSKILPYSLRLNLRKKLSSLLGETVSKGWDNYARNFKAAPGKHLGEEWNEPEVIGIDVPADQIVSALDARIFAPFLGSTGTLLEIGSGGGRFTQILLPKAQKVIAADTSPHMLSLIRERFGDATNFECLQLDGQGLAPLQAQSIDAAFSFDVFVHLEQWDIYNYIRELKRVLKPGGKGIIHYGNCFSELGWKRFLSDIPAQLNVPKVWGTFSFMTPEIFKEFIARAGLEHVETITDVVRRDAITLFQSPGK